MTWIARAALLAATAALLAGCASTSPSISLIEPEAALTYAVSPAEQHWHCGGLQNAIDARVTRIVALKAQAKAETEAAAPTISRLFTRLFDGPGADSPALKQIATERAAANAYNDELRSKGCQSVDIDAKIAAAPPPAVPLKVPDGPTLPAAPASIKGVVGGI
jgi:ABC-type Fe3+-hydroxamate transport system substrate-binding protein